MKALLISACLFAPALALANDETYGLEKKADNKHDAKKSDDIKKDEKKDHEQAKVQTDLSQSQLLDKLHKVNTGHVEMGNLAQTHAKSDKLKRLGDKMAKDFTTVDQNVIAYAKDHDIVLADATGMFKGRLDKAELNQKGEKFGNLGKLQGEQFDKQFLSAITEGCEKFIPVLEGAKGKFDDAKFDRVLGKAVDTLKSYQKDAEKLQKDYAPST